MLSEKAAAHRSYSMQSALDNLESKKKEKPEG